MCAHIQQFFCGLPNHARNHLQEKANSPQPANDAGKPGYWMAFAVCLIAGLLPSVQAQEKRPAPQPAAAVAEIGGPDAQGPSAYKKLSLQELMDIEVTSVSKRAEKLSETASAIQVITQEDIR